MVLNARVDQVDFNQVTHTFEDGLEFFTKRIAIGRVCKLRGLFGFAFIGERCSKELEDACLRTK